MTATTATTSTATNGVVDVSWNVSMGATSYAVQASANGGPYTTMQTLSATKTTLSGLTIGTSYSIVVAATGATGTTRSAPVTWIAKKYLLQ